MTDYSELIKKLRDLHRDPRPASAVWLFDNQIALYDAAAAIEALDRLLDQNTQRCEALRKQLREAHESYERHLNDLEAEVKRLKLSCADCEYGNSPWPEEPVHEPKRGEWIKHPEVKNIYGGVCIECPFCGEKYVVQNVSDEKFCRNCGADMRAKMEVQDGQ